MNDVRSRRGAAAGRHAFRDPADDPGYATPIFNALVSAGWPPRNRAQADTSAAVTATLRAVTPAPIERSPRRGTYRAAAPLGHPAGRSRGSWQPVAVPGSGGRRHLDPAPDPAPAAHRSGRHHRRLVPLDGGLAG